MIQIVVGVSKKGSWSNDSERRCWPIVKLRSIRVQLFRLSAFLVSGTFMKNPPYVNSVPEADIVISLVYPAIQTTFREQYNGESPT